MPYLPAHYGTPHLQPPPPSPSLQSATSLWQDNRFYNYSLLPSPPPSVNPPLIATPVSSSTSAEQGNGLLPIAPTTTSFSLIAASEAQAAYFDQSPPPLPESVLSKPIRASSGPFYFRDRMSRALQLVGLRHDMAEADLIADLSLWGEIRALQLHKQSDGLVTVHYYDIRAARSALTDIQHQHLLQQQRVQKQLWRLAEELSDHINEAGAGESIAGRADDTIINMNVLEIHGADTESKHSADPAAVTDPAQASAIDSELAGGGASTTTSKGLIGGKAIWAHYTIPVDLQTDDCMNQGTLVVFNLDMNMEPEEVREIFERYGKCSLSYQ